MHKRGEDSVSDGLDDLKSHRTIDADQRQGNASLQEHSRLGLIQRNENTKFSIGLGEEDNNNYGADDLGEKGRGRKSVLAQNEANDSDEEKQRLQDEDKEEDGDELEDHIVDGFKAGGTNHEANMKQFMKNYGQLIDIPGFYIMDTKIFPDRTC